VSPILESIGSVKGFGWGAFAETSAFNSIASTLGGNSSITFSSIPQTYKHLQLRMTLGVTGSTGQSDAAWVRVNGITSSVYFMYRIAVQGGVEGTIIQPNNSMMRLNNVAYGTSASPSGYRGSTLMTFFDYTGSTRKTAQALTAMAVPGSPHTLSNVNNYIDNIDPITSITILTSDGNNFSSDSVLSLYGIKGE
jgi:hypothetical protein